jgi:hypothetical protein
MRQEDTELFNLLHAARRNTIWSGQGQNSVATNMHIGTTLHLIESALSILKNRTQITPAK